MKSIIFIRRGTNACTHYRVDIPSKYLQSCGYDIQVLESTHDISLDDVSNKIFIFSRSCFRRELEKFRAIKAAGGIVIYELDDYLLDLPSSNPATRFYLKVQGNIRCFLREADYVIVTTEHLRELYLKLNQNIFIINNYIDYDFLHNSIEPVFYRKDFSTIVKNLEGRFVILWAGSSTHREDLKLIENQLISFLKKYPDVLLVAIHTFTKSAFLKISFDQLLLVNAVLPNEYLSLLSKIPVQIGLAPLILSEFNLSKSRLRLIEYMSTKIVPIASDIGDYANTLKYSPFSNSLCSDSDWFHKLQEAYNFWDLGFLSEEVSVFAEKTFSIKKSNWVNTLKSV